MKHKKVKIRNPLVEVGKFRNSAGAMDIKSNKQKRRELKEKLKKEIEEELTDEA